MDEDYDDALEKFLHSDVNSVYVKADQVDIRVHLIGTFSHLIENMGAESCIDEFRKLEQYVRYG